MRDWEADGEAVGLKFIGKEGENIVCEKEGFIFRVHCSNWAPLKLSPSQCTDPTSYFKFLVQKLHGNLYDLSETVFTGADNKVKARCSLHGFFQIDAKYFSSKRGCPECGSKPGGEKNSSNTKDFIEKAKHIHGDKYDYSLVSYTKAKEDVDIICKIHGVFSITASGHLSSKGCKYCGFEISSRSRTLSQEEILRRFNKVHGDKYDYSLVEYNGDAHAHLSIICKEHGVFQQSYANHNSGQGCPICAKEFSPRLKSGFVKSAEKKNYASLYLIRCYDEFESFYKIGITTKEIKRRFYGNSSLPYKYEILHVFVGTGGLVWDAETKLHRFYKNMRYIPTKQFGGMYECFSEINLQEFIENLKIFTTL